MLPDASQFISFDRHEFATAFTWAMNAISGAAQIADPTTVGFDFEAQDGRPMQVRFNDTSVTRLGIAMRERYGADPEKAQSAMFRIWALMDLIRSGRLAAWLRPASDGTDGQEIALAVVYAAALVPLNKEYQFPVWAFLQRVREIESGRDS
jgi:hypothetical protein